MIKTKYDVVVVGAGPAGSYTAKHCALAGLSVLLLEKRPVVGVPVRCGEATASINKLSKLVDINPEWMEGDLHGVLVYTPFNKFLYNRREIGSMIDREKFDQDLAQQAQKAGATLLTDARVSAISTVANQVRTVTIETTSGTHFIEATMLVGADGSESLCGQWVGLKSRQHALHTCSALEYQLEGTDPNPNVYTFWLDYPGIPIGYVWAFPKNKSNLINIGCGAITPKLNEPNMATVLNKFKEEYYPNYKIKKVHGGAVPVSGFLQQYSTDHFLLVGDAAHHTDPLTGGGIEAGLLTGKIAAEAISIAFKQNNFSEAFFKEQYEAKCWEKVGKSHQKSLRFRMWMFGLSKAHKQVFYSILAQLAKTNFSLWGYISVTRPLIALLYGTFGNLITIFKKTKNGFTYLK